MPRAVRFTEYGSADVLHVVEVDRPVPGPGRVLVRVKAAGINPGEIGIREGRFAARWPAVFPSGQGSDLAGMVEELGEGVDGFAVGDEVLGFTNDRASHAELVAVEAEKLIPRPSAVPWEAAGALFVAGAAAYASVRAVAPSEGETVVVSAAAGGVGAIAVQLCRSRGARVIGLASEPHHAWLSAHGVLPVAYGAGAADRVRAVAGGNIDAFIDTFGSDYVELALALGARPERINTIANFEAKHRYGVKTDGTSTAATAAVLTELATAVAEGRLDIPIARVYPLDEVREAYAELARRHTLGKIVLRP